MDVIIPVAGLGTRLRPHTWSKPKPLVSVAGKPMLEHVLDRVMPHNPEQIVFITGYLGEQIEAWAKATYTIPLHFVEQPEMLGQTDAIIRARDIAREDALILFPDMLFEADFAGLADLGVDGVMYTKEVEDPSALGIAVTDETGKIVKLIEKPQEPISRLAVIGIYYIRHMPDLYAAIEEQMQRGIKTKNEYFIADAIQLMIDAGKTIIPKNVEVWEDCGNTNALLQTNRYLLDSDPPPPVQRPGSFIIPPSFVHRSATVENAIVGPHASIGAGAVVRDAVVRDSIVEDESIVEKLVLEHSVIGRRAHIVGTAARMSAGDNTQIGL